jgi:polyphosphate kinase
VTAAERIAKAHRAQSALDEFFAPMFANLREEYVNRLSEVATTELHPGNRADKITTLSVALKVVDTLRSGMNEAIRDGELAHASKLKAEKIEQLSDAQQRLLKITGY